MSLQTLSDSSGNIVAILAHCVVKISCEINSITNPQITEVTPLVYFANLHQFLVLHIIGIIFENKKKCDNR